MAFATTNVQTGTTGSLKFYCGDWTGTVGDTSGTVTLNGGRIYERQFVDESASSPAEYTQTSVSQSGSTITITVHNHKTVTAGRFYIVYS